MIVTEVHAGFVLKVSCDGDIQRITFEGAPDFSAVDAAIRGIWPLAGARAATFDGADGAARALTYDNFEEFKATARIGPAGRHLLRLEVAPPSSAPPPASRSSAGDSNTVAGHAAKAPSLHMPGKVELKLEVSVPTATGSPSSGGGKAVQKAQIDQPSGSRGGAKSSALARHARRRVAAAVATPPTQWQEDTRDIEELLRDLGLPESPPRVDTAKKRRQGKKTASSAGRCEVARPQKKDIEKTSTHAGQEKPEEILQLSTKRQFVDQEDQVMQPVGKSTLVLEVQVARPTAVQVETQEEQQQQPQEREQTREQEEAMAVNGADEVEMKSVLEHAEKEVVEGSAEFQHEGSGCNENDAVEEPMSLWPATPESTPPTSPRLAAVPQLYYWLAVPVWPSNAAAAGAPQMP